MPTRPVTVAIVDYGLGNLYSVKQACAHVGAQASITSAKNEILEADAIILPGVGAFGDAMDTLRALDLVTVIRGVVDSGRPVLGVCLGMQLLMTESHEFGRREGLGIIDGPVVRFDHPRDGERQLKVPQIGWNAIARPTTDQRLTDPWRGTLLDGIADGEPMYFVHSYTVQPSDPQVILATSTYGGIRFCSSLQRRNVVACQFHPERSGTQGLRIYRNFANGIARTRDGELARVEG